MHRKPKINNSSKIFCIIFSVIAIICAVIGIIYDNYRRKQDDQNKELYSKTKDSVVASDGDADEFVINWDELEKYEIVGWLKFDENIDYPIVQGETNDTYLRSAIDGSYNIAGSIFLSANNMPDFSDQNSIVYGHNMRNGTMFGTLRNYLDANFNGVNSFDIYLPDGTKHSYMIFSINQVYDGSVAYQYCFTNNEEFKDYQELMKNTSIKDCNIKVDENKNIVTLSTCSSIGSSQGKRVVITGMEYSVTKTQEPASWYNRINNKKKSIQERRKKK